MRRAGGPAYDGRATPRWVAWRPIDALTDSAPPSARPAAALLRDRNFGPYFWANLVSNCGTWFWNVTAAVVVFNMTGSATVVGAVSVMQFVPSMLLAPYAGALTDRIDRRLLLLGSQLLGFMAATVISVWTVLVGVDGLPGPWPILAVALVVGVAYAFSVPAMHAVIPALVPPPDLDAAVALNSVTFNLARALGPALGALTLGTLGPAATFTINAASFLPLVVALLVIHPRAVQRRRAGSGSVREGLAYVWGDRTTVVLLLGVTALGFGADPVNTLTPPMAALLGGGDALVGWLVSGFGAGAAVTAFTVTPLRRRFTLNQMSAGGLVGIAAGLFALAASPAAGVAIASLALAGSGFLFAVTALTTALQQRVDEDMRGRVMALWSVAFLGSRPIAALLDGLLADLFGARAAVVWAGGLTLIAAVVITRSLRRVPLAS